MSIDQMKKDDDSLADLFLDFAEAVLARIQSRVNEDQEMPQYLFHRIVFVEDHPLSTVEVWPDYEKLVLGFWEVDAEWVIEAGERCARAYLKAGILRPPKLKGRGGEPVARPTFEQIRHHLVLELLPCIWDAVVRSGTLNPTQEQLAESLDRFRPFWHGTLYLTFTVPLLNFTSEVENVPIGPRLELAPFTSEDKSSLASGRALSPLLIADQAVSFTAFRKARFKLVGSYTCGRQDGVVDIDIVDEVGRVLTALRLLKGGRVGASACFGTGGWFYIQALHTYRVASHDLSYELSESDLPGLVELVDTLGGDVESKLRVALRWFNRSYGREMGEDRIIDLAVALESCLLSGIPEELSYRLSLRGATLLARSRDPEQAHLLLRVLYRARSEIVHGGGFLSGCSTKLKRDMERITPPLKSPEELPERCEEVVRDVLKAYVGEIAACHSLEDINAELDRNLIRSLAQSSE